MITVTVCTSHPIIQRAASPTLGLPPPENTINCPNLRMRDAKSLTGHQSEAGVAARKGRRVFTIKIAEPIEKLKWCLPLSQLRSARTVRELDRKRVKLRRRALELL